MADPSENLYTFTFGMYKEQTIEDAGGNYCNWLVRVKAYRGKPDLAAALIAADYLPPDSSSFTPPPTPTPAKTSCKRRALSDDETEGPPSIWRKLGMSHEAQLNDTMPNYEGSAYFLDFGMYEGVNWEDVPRNYIRWLIDEGIPEKRPDLKSGLQERGLLPIEQNTPPGSQESPRKTPGWKVPSTRQTLDPRFFYGRNSTPAWISDADAAFYFGLKEPVLSSRGVGLVTEADVKREAEFGELICVTRSPKRWLYQVYKCAVKFGGVPSSRGTAERALEDYLNKNQRRKEQIWDEMGLGA